jgi:predicted DNA-binding transcriptional regulator YafY
LNTATRLITLIMLMQRQPNQKAGELARQLGVSIRSVHRYMAMLDEMGIPVYSERGPYGGFSLVRGYKMPPLIFTPEEAVAVHLGTGLVKELWGQMYQDAAQGALAKLDNVLPDEQRQEIAWARRTLLATGMHRSDADMVAPLLDSLRRAARERRRVTMAYRGRSQTEPARRDLDPYALVHRWGWWYVVGYCHLRQAVRSFRVDRIAGLTLLDQSFEVPGDFDIHRYLATEYQPQPAIRVRLRFAPPAVPLARGDDVYWDALDEQPDGSAIVAMTAFDLEYPARLALSFGPDVEVLEPEELRRQVGERARAIAEKYRL